MEEFSINSYEVTRRNTLLTDLEKANALALASVGLVPAVQVHLITDPEQAAVAHAYTASNKGYDHRVYSDTARRAVEKGQVLVSFQAEGRMNLSPLYARADAILAAEAARQASNS